MIMTDIREARDRGTNEPLNTTHSSIYSESLKEKMIKPHKTYKNLAMKDIVWTSLTHTLFVWIFDSCQKLTSLASFKWHVLTE